jgi:hypothetical protein
MSLRSFVLASVSVAALGAASAPASASLAQTLTGNQWYTGAFGTSGYATAGKPLLAATGFSTGTNGPILPSGSATAINTTQSTWYISAPNGGYLTVTDVETSGDQFTMSDNSSGMTPTSGALGGQVGLSGGTTSTPLSTSDVSCSTMSNPEDIGCALADENYSSGTFALVDGDNYITGVLAAGTANGSSGAFDFIVELNSTTTSTPEPASIAIVTAGLAGLGIVRRRRKPG